MTSFKSYLGEQLKDSEFKQVYETEVKALQREYADTWTETLEYSQSSAADSRVLHVADSADSTLL
jgi:hypothetical protein